MSDGITDATRTDQIILDTWREYRETCDTYTVQDYTAETELIEFLRTDPAAVEKQGREQGWIK
jgi:hypothetical protein